MPKRIVTKRYNPSALYNGDGSYVLISDHRTVTTDKLVNYFFDCLRVVDGLKSNGKQNLKYGIKWANASADISTFLSLNYFKDNNTEFDMYKMIVDKDYGAAYMSNYSVNEFVRDAYFKPRGLKIVYDKEHGVLFAVKNGRAIELFYNENTYSVINYAARMRENIEKECRLLIANNDGVSADPDLLANMMAVNLSMSVVMEYKAVIAQWILDKNIQLTVEDFMYAYIHPHNLRTVVKDGIGAVDFNANPHKYNPVIEESPETPLYDESVSTYTSWDDIE